jgi:hypothetical protein
VSSSKTNQLTPNKTYHPTTTTTTIVQGKSFGDCRCGHPKSEHKAGSGVPHDEAWAKNAHAPVAVVVEETTGGDGCDNYQVNMSAANFGECVCGKPKSAHAKGGGKPRGSGLGQLKVTSPPLPAATPIATAVVDDEYEPGACDNFNLDVTNSSFGMCTCGWKKADHGKPRKKKEKGGAAPAPVALHAEHAGGHPCDHYEVDVLSTKVSI